MPGVAVRMWTGVAVGSVGLVAVLLLAGCDERPLAAMGRPTSASPAATEAAANVTASRPRTEVSASSAATAVAAATAAPSAVGTPLATSTPPSGRVDLVATAIPATPPTPGPPAPGVPPVSVYIENFEFSKTGAVAIGTAVTWTNRDSSGHDVSTDDKSFGSGRLVQGASYTLRFERFGSVDYHCSIHPYMTGTITVR